MAATDQQQEDARDLQEPAHHARRPMNAFLIFCKRHRSSVRKEFPHLENRAVTRVLGEWWATLHPDQKRAYTNLAQEYKDAFLNANPDFKWYKLPAPPLRTLTTRPTNKKQESGVSEHSLGSNSNFQPSEDSKTEERNGDGAIQPGKLADETQIGGLSSLFTPEKGPPKPVEGSPVDSGGETEQASGIPKPPRKQHSKLLVDAEQKRKCKVDLFSGQKSLILESNNNDQLHSNEEQLTKKNLDGLEEYEGEEKSNARGKRSCKGLRYQQLMAKQQQRNMGIASQQNKRRHVTGLNTAQEFLNGRRISVSSNVSEKTDSLSSEGGNSSRSDLEHLVESAEGKLEASKPEDTGTEGAQLHQEYGEWPPYKRFRAEDFNLEKKIEALPSLSLEEFQEKKKQQRTKKKRVPQAMSRSSAKRNLSENLDNGKSTDESCELREDAEKALLVGSQKRKARKQSITRNAAGISASKKSDDQDANKPWCSSPDLEALACLAEIAANRTKLTK